MQGHQAVWAGCDRHRGWPSLLPERCDEVFLSSDKWVPLLPCVAGCWKGHWWVLPLLFFLSLFFFNQNVKVIVSSELPFPCLNCDRESNKGIYPWMSLMIFPHTEEESSLLSGCCQMFPLSNERSLSINHSIAVSPAVARELGRERYKASWEV